MVRGVTAHLDGFRPLVAGDLPLLRRWLRTPLIAQAAYRRAGFAGGAVVETGEGPAVLMSFGG